MAFIDTTDRHPGTVHIAQFFEFDHLRSELLKEVSQECALLADTMVDALSDSPELLVGLRKLLEAKDAFVRCAILEEAME